MSLTIVEHKGKSIRRDAESKWRREIQRELREGVIGFVFRECQFRLGLEKTSYLYFF